MSALSVPTADLCDRHADRVAQGLLQIARPAWVALGARASFQGPVATVQAPQDNSMVRALLEEPGLGRVLVVDGGGSLECALVGGNLAQLAAEHDWSGIIVNGCVRDADEIDRCALGLRALATHPRRSDKRGLGARDLVLSFAGVSIRPGDWIYADRDGWLVSTGGPLPA